VNAFGLTGVEGTFRLSCEHVLNILRKERDVILMLLESFIHDPLIEWNMYPSSNPNSNMNPYALKIWKKIKWKLEGRDPDPTKKLSIPDQVDFIIKQAMDIENLSLMYEGWTSWV
jgi:phosphatidylinositol kinase/protein kinase (PI-3  family)